MDEIRLTQAEAARLWGIALRYPFTKDGPRYEYAPPTSPSEACQSAIARACLIGECVYFRYSWISNWALPSSELEDVLDRLFWKCLQEYPKES